MYVCRWILFNIMFLKFQNKQQRFFLFIDYGCVYFGRYGYMVLCMVEIFWFRSEWVKRGCRDCRIESVIAVFFLCLPYFCFKRYIFTSLAITSIINGVYLYLYWMSSTPPCCGDMGQGLITMLYMFISGVYFVVSCGIIIDYLYSKKVQKNRKSS